MQPINYGVEIQDPSQSFLSAFQTGASIQEARLKQEQQQQQMANQKLIQEGFAKLRQPGATAADYANLAMVLPETQAKSVRESFSMLSGERQKNAKQQSGQVFSAFKAGKPEIAISLLDRQIEGKRNSGDEEGAKFLETWRDVAKVNPQATEDFFGYMLSDIPDGDKIIDSAIKLGGERRAAALQPSALTKAEAEAKTKKIESDFAQRMQEAGLTEKNWSVKNLQNQINVRGAQLGLDRQRLAMDTQIKLAEVAQKANQIPEGAQKLINEAAVTAGTTKQQAGQYNDLASRITAIGSSWGSLGSGAEWLKKATGEQGAVSALRQEFTRLRNSAAVGSLPPGPATDKDISMVLEGFPPSTANPEQLSSFLRGMAKLKDIESSVEGAKVDWLAGNRGALTRAQNTFQAGDYAVKQGETFADFSNRVAKDVARRYSGGSSLQSRVDQIPTKGSTGPATQNVNVRSAADAILAGGR